MGTLTLAEYGKLTDEERRLLMRGEYRSADDTKLAITVRSQEELDTEPRRSASCREVQPL